MFQIVDCISTIPLLRIARKVEVKFCLELSHLERVHIFYDPRDLQRTVCGFSIVEEQHDLLSE